MKGELIKISAKLLVTFFPLVVISISVVSWITYRNGAAAVLAGQDVMMNKRVEKTLKESDGWFNENVSQSLVIAGQRTHDLSLVSTDVGGMLNSSNQVCTSAEQLKEMASQLSSLVRRFKV